MLLAICFLLARDHVALLILISIFFATASQFFGTTDAVTVPSVVPQGSADRREQHVQHGRHRIAARRHDLPRADPPADGRATADVLFVIAAVMFAVVGGVRVAHAADPRATMRRPIAACRRSRELRDAAGDYMSTLRTLARDPVSRRWRSIHYATGSSLVLLFAVLVPRYMQAILQVSPDKAVTIFAPVGVGAILGLRALPLIAAASARTAPSSSACAGLRSACSRSALVEPIAHLLKRRRTSTRSASERAGGLSILVLLTMAFAGPLGFAYALVNAPAQTVLHERAPAEMRGRVFAAQVVLANAVGILPLIVAGLGGRYLWCEPGALRHRGRDGDDRRRSASISRRSGRRACGRRRTDRMTGRRDERLNSDSLTPRCRAWLDWIAGRMEVGLLD